MIINTNNFITIAEYRFIFLKAFEINKSILKSDYFGNRIIMFSNNQQ